MEEDRLRSAPESPRRQWRFLVYVPSNGSLGYYTETRNIPEGQEGNMTAWRRLNWSSAVPA